jgi:hypothetical protein
MSGIHRNRNFWNPTLGGSGGPGCLPILRVVAVGAVAQVVAVAQAVCQFFNPLPSCFACDVLMVMMAAGRASASDSVMEQWPKRRTTGGGGSRSCRRPDRAGRGSEPRPGADLNPPPLCTPTDLPDSPSWMPVARVP